MNSLTMRWSTMAAREKLFVSLAASFLLLAALIFGLIEPAARGIRALNQRLPVLAAQKIQIEQLAANVSKAAPQVTPSRETLTQSAASMNVTAEVSGDGPFTLKFQGASFGAIVNLAGSFKRSFGLAVRDAKFERQPVGTVSGQLVLAR